jgi:hypothetical protein
MNFQSILQHNVPKGRDGKHKKIVTQLLSDIEQLNRGTALKVPLASALNRATHQRGIDIATSSDADFLYVWKPERPA